MENKDKYILKYPEEDLVKILKNSGYHSEECEETDPEEEWPIAQPEVEDNDEETTKRKSSSIYTYDKWWRSSAVCIFIILLVYLSKTLIVIYLFKLLRLLHDRIDPTAKLLQKKPSDVENNKIRKRNTSGMPPIGAPSWCLNQDALKRFNRSNENIPIYDRDTDSKSDNCESDNHESSEEISNRNSSKKKKRKDKKKSKQKRNKRHKSK